MYAFDQSYFHSSIIIGVGGNIKTENVFLIHNKPNYKKYEILGQNK